MVGFSGGHVIDLVDACSRTSLQSRPSLGRSTAPDLSLFAKLWTLRPHIHFVFVPPLPPLPLAVVHGQRRLLSLGTPPFFPIITFRDSRKACGFSRQLWQLSKCSVPRISSCTYYVVVYKVLLAPFWFSSACPQFFFQILPSATTLLLSFFLPICIPMPEFCPMMIYVHKSLSLALFQRCNVSTLSFLEDEFFLAKIEVDGGRPKNCIHPISNEINHDPPHPSKGD